MTWSTAWDKDNFYFAAAVRDDKFTPGPDTDNAWKGDCIFLYIDWENLQVGSPQCKPNFSLIKNKELTLAKIRIFIFPQLLLSVPQHWERGV
ncbi:hypothetical protein CMK22_14990 [Candidatus Poribacteria bacterium]|nr:hypothetical protein [Candidatus Poribacteria bacterium]